MKSPGKKLIKRCSEVSRKYESALIRYQRWVSFIAIASALNRAKNEKIIEEYCVKGGASIELRYGAIARTTKDFDVGLRGDIAARQKAFADAVKVGWDEFQLEVKANRGPLVMGEVDTVRVNVALKYRGKDWQTIEVDLGALSDGFSVETVAPTIKGFDELGLPTPAEIACLDIYQQLAQKMHACTSLKNEKRAKDVADILFLRDKVAIDDDLFRDAVIAVFARRNKHECPTVFSFPNEWKAELMKLLKGVDLEYDSIEKVEAEFNRILDIVNAK